MAIRAEGMGKEWEIGVRGYGRRASASQRIDARAVDGRVCTCGATSGAVVLVVVLEGGVEGGDFAGRGVLALAGYTSY